MVSECNDHPDVGRQGESKRREGADKKGKEVYNLHRMWNFIRLVPFIFK